MTNSHNRQQSGVRSAERYYTNASPQHTGGNGSSNSNSSSNGNNSSHKKRGQKSPISMSTSQPLPITPPKYRQNQTNSRSSPGGFCHSSSPSSNNYNNYYNNNNGNNNGGVMVSHSPPNFSYYAGSKCYDSPAPTALPRPPTHWTLSCAQSAAQYINKQDDFSHNLKIMLNVKA